MSKNTNKTAAVNDMDKKGYGKEILNIQD